MPEDVRAAAIASFRERRADLDVAGLVFDTLLDTVTVEDETIRLLRFAHGRRTVEIEVHRDGDSMYLDVEVQPPDKSLIQARHSGHSIYVETDDAGRARVAGLRPGLVSLVLLPTGGRTGRPLATAWLAF